MKRMSNSYKFYSDTKDDMKKYVNATEGAIIYGISKSRIMVLASEAGAVYKVGNSALINTERFDSILKNLKNLRDHFQSIFGTSWKQTWTKTASLSGRIQSQIECCIGRIHRSRKK